MDAVYVEEMPVRELKEVITAAGLSYADCLGCSHRLHAACVLGPDSLASHAWAENRPSLRRGQQVVCPVCRTTSWIPPGFL